ncbi:hypothetical protein J4714_13215, partial [Staphylococcus epidermidis]|nr:hypothetical protein [Staphylococcus epidermidis]
MAASLTQAEQRSASLAAQLAAAAARVETLLAERQQAAKPPVLASEADKLAYAAGVSLGRDILHLQQENRRAGWRRRVRCCWRASPIPWPGGCGW